MKRSVINAILTPRDKNISFGFVKDETMNPDELWEKFVSYRKLFEETLNKTKYNNISNKNKNINKINSISFKNINLTNHGCNALYYRLGLSDKTEMQKLCARAKRFGLNLNAVEVKNTDRLGLNKEEIEWLKDKYIPHTTSTIGYFYKGYIFVFAGSKSSTLKTVFRPGYVGEEIDSDNVVDKFLNEQVE